MRTNSAKALADRFKNRGKRPAPSSVDPPTTPASTSADASSAGEASSGKRMKLSEYEKEVARLSTGKGLREEGVGVNALLK